MKKIMVLFISILLVLTVNVYANTPQVTSNTFNRIVVFGDSLSDTGNLYKYFMHIMPKSPPYHKGHFSNGELWVEDLARKFNLDPTKGSQVKNYAVGGASAVLKVNGHQLPYNFREEIDMYDLEEYSKPRGNVLYVIWMGANDYLGDRKNIDAAAKETATTIGQDIEHLIKDGGRLFLVPNLPNLGKTPYALDPKRPKNFSPDLTRLAQLHNQYLATVLQGLRDKYKNVTIVAFDVASRFKDLRESPQDYGLNNTTQACYQGGYTVFGAAMQAQGVSAALPTDDDDLTTEQKAFLNNLSKEKREAILASPALREALRVDAYTQKRTMQLSLTASQLGPLNCSGYLFWDHVHPTAYAHAKLADFAYQALTAAGINQSSDTE